MEKNAVRAKRKLFLGLLKKIAEDKRKTLFRAFFLDFKRGLKRAALPLGFLLTFAAPAVFAKSFSRAEFKNLFLKADSEIFFTMAKNGYTLLIPHVKSENVQIDISSLPPGTKLDSSKKDDFFDENGEHSARIQFWFTFSDAGIAKIPPLTAKISGQTYYFPFEEVKIYENPNLISPSLSVEFFSPENLFKDKSGNLIYKCRAGEEIRYKILIQYSSQIINFSFELPKDSIFEETKRYEIAKSGKNAAFSNKEFTPEKFPLAEFSWKPLKEGEFDLPNVSVEALSYSGAQKQISLPQIFVAVEKSKSLKQNQKNNFQELPKELKNAFSVPKAATESENQNQNQNQKKYSPTAQDCKTLADLRSKEKHSFFWSDAAQKRREFELSIGISQEENEKKNPLANIFNLGKKYGIFSGGKICKVPEEKSPFQNAPAALRVQISERAAGWLFVECKDFSGWVKQESVFVIE